MKKNDKLMKVVELQTRARPLNKVVGLVVGGFVAGFVQVSYGLLPGLITLAVLGWCVYKIFDFISYARIMKMVYDGDNEALVRDADNYLKDLTTPKAKPLDQLQLRILAVSGKPIGKYMDAEIYEWMLVETIETGQKIKCEFFGTVDLSKGVAPPPGTLTFGPGISYSIVPQVDPV